MHRSGAKCSVQRPVAVVVVGSTLLNSSSFPHARFFSGWRPKIPQKFRSKFPAVTKLIKRCWATDQHERPKFTEICSTLEGMQGGPFDYAQLETNDDPPIQDAGDLARFDGVSEKKDSEAELMRKNEALQRSLNEYAARFGPLLGDDTTVFGVEDTGIYGD